MRESRLLFNETKYSQRDAGGLRTLEDAVLDLEKGVYY